MPENGVPAMPVMIGGGPAALGRAPGTLLVDAGGGPYHRGVLPGLAQTPDLLRLLTDRGFDPYRYAAPSGRVPALAVRQWLDSLAAAGGPLVNGTGRLTMLSDGALAAVIQPDSGEPLVVEVTGTPTLAPGLPRQLSPGTRPELSTFDATARTLLHQVIALGPDADLLFAGLVEVINRRSGAEAVLALLDSAGPDLRSRLADPIDAMRAFAALQHARAAARGPLCFGDRLTMGEVAATAADSWIVAGGGDDALAAAEVLLTGNAVARVTVIAGRIDPAAANNARYAELCRHFGPDSGDGRLEFRTGAEPGPICVAPATGRFTEAGVEADGYVACAGRSAELPSAVGGLVEQTRTLRGRLGGTLLFDEARQYLGYRLHFAVAGRHHKVDVTGAASWHLPAEVFPAALRSRLTALGGRAVPPESGSSPTDLLPVVEQAAGLAAARQRGTVTEANDVPDAWL